jgi:uridine kinase
MNNNFLFPDEEISRLKIDKIIKRNGMVAAFDRDKIVNSIYRAAVEVGGSDRLLAEKLAERVVAIINTVYPAGSTPTVEEIQDIIEEMLVEGGHYKTAKAYILYRAEHARIREKKDARIVVEDNVPYKILWRFFTWNVDNGCDTIEKLNRKIKDGSFPALVAAAEKFYHAEIDKVAQQVLREREDLRLFIVAGPSSSGKTTTTMKIGERLRAEGINFILLNVDNYFKDLEQHPKDEFGDYDFEIPEALDLEMINEHLRDLLQGKAIMMPEYNFKTGKRRLNARELRLEKGQIVLIDSLHGLYPAMTASVPQEMKFRFYIEALCQIRDRKGEFVRWADLRMLRRMVRDSWHRGYNPEQTVGHWHYVRRSEKQYIVPFINKVDYIFNGALPYEFPVYKKFLFRNLEEIVKKYENQPKRVDAYIRARRVLGLMAETDELADDSCVPRDSLMREFIGGSSYRY